MQKRAVFVVGHENWGKSYTLNALEEICDHQGRRVTIGGHEFLVRKTSNDDIMKEKPKSYTDFIEHLSRPYVIAALCPKFKKLANYDDPQKLADGILESIQTKGYELFFWLIKHKWNHPTDEITPAEASELEQYGTVRIFPPPNHEAQERATQLRTFIADVVLG